MARQSVVGFSCTARQAVAKTHLARATAGEINATFLSVGISDVLEMWLGNSERNLHQLFQQARRNKPCVLFFDEVDALAASRTDMRTSAARHMINQFLSEMDGVDSSNEGVLTLAATNAPWHVDAAFRRPGRFDRILFVPPPDQAARAAILRIHLVGNRSRKSITNTCEEDRWLLRRGPQGGGGHSGGREIEVGDEVRAVGATDHARPHQRRCADQAVDKRNGLPLPAIMRSTPIRAGPTTTSSST